MHTFIHSCVHTCIHSYVGASIHAYIRASMHACIHSYIHSHIRTYIHTHMPFMLQYVCFLYIAGGGGAGPSSILGGSRMGPSGSVDDTVIASLIWDSPSHHHQSHEAPSPGLQKSPLHKSTSALTDLQEGGVVSMATTTATASHFNYQGQPHLVPHNSRDQYNRSVSYRAPDDMFSPPPLPPVSAIPTRNQGTGLPDFNLTDEIFQHFSGRSAPRRDVTPPNSALPEYLSPRQTAGPDVRSSHFPLPPPMTSSPIKRNSSPEVVGRYYGDQRAQSNSPDVFLPTPEHHRHWQPQHAHSHSNSHHLGGAPGRSPHSNSRSSSTSKTNYRSGMTGAPPQSVTSPPWYDGMGAGHQHYHQGHHSHHHKPHTETNRTPHREEGGAYHHGQQQQHTPKSAGAVPLPRRRNEESVGIQEFLHDLASSKTNPFNEGGTLV